MTFTLPGTRLWVAPCSIHCTKLASTRGKDHNRQEKGKSRQQKAKKRGRTYPRGLSMDFLNGQDPDNIDNLINDLGGCGRFQVFVIFFLLLIKVVSPLSMMMMAFGNYNPGWKCLDNITLADSNLTLPSAMANPNDTHHDDDDECRAFERCANVEFTPGVSTIVTEWHLLCDNAWVTSLIISIQMFGVLIGAWAAGYVGDKFGRKIAMYLMVLFHAVVNIITMFSTSWQMFAVMRFLIGFAIPFLLYSPIILSLEFVPPKWRNVIICCPIWTIGCIVFTISAMITEDWRYLHGVNALASFIILVPCYWMPESLRWLVVKDRMKAASVVVRNIATLNRIKDHGLGRLQKIAYICRNQTQSDDHSFLHLLKRGVRKSTIIIGISCITMSSVYYAISFGVKNLPGSLYVNFFIMFSSELPITLFSSTLPNYLGRKVSIIFFLGITTACLFCIVGLDQGAGGSVKTTGILINALTARVTVDAAWDIIFTYIGELYPTVIRSTSVAYSSWIARIGGILAPYLIPDNPDTFFIYYLAMAALSLVCCFLLTMLPETKGKPLQDTWEIKVPDPNFNDDEIEDGTIAENGKVKLNGDTHV